MGAHRFAIGLLDVLALDKVQSHPADRAIVELAIDDYLKRLRGLVGSPVACRG